MSDRLSDSYRAAPIFERYFERAKESFGREPSDSEVRELYRKALAKAFPDDPVDSDKSLHKFIGNDLSDEDLDGLWNCFTGRDIDNDDIPTLRGWWENKPHQIGYRLLLRLTRVENELKKLKESGDE